MTGMKGLAVILSISAATFNSAHAKILRGPYGSKDKKWCKADCEFFTGCTDYHYEDKKCTLYAAHVADPAPDGPEAKRPFDVSFASPDKAWCRKECEMTPGCDDFYFDSAVRECTLTGKSPTPDGSDRPKGKRPFDMSFTTPDKAWCRKECEMTPGCDDYHFDSSDKECTVTGKSPTTDGPDGPEGNGPCSTPLFSPCGNRPLDTAFRSPDETWCRKECEMTPRCDDYHFNSGDKECTLTGKSPTTDGPDGSKGKGPCSTPIYSPDKIWCERECESTPSCTDFEFHKHEKKCVFTCEVPSAPPPVHNLPHHPSPPPEVKPCIIGETFTTEDKDLCLEACELTPDCHDVEYMNKECTCNDAPAPSPNPHRKIELPYAHKVEFFKQTVWKW